MRWDEAIAITMTLGLAAFLVWQWWHSPKSGSILIRWSTIKRSEYPILFEINRWLDLALAGGLVAVVIYVLAFPQP
jgi:hypothetical protein